MSSKHVKRRRAAPYTMITIAAFAGLGLTLLLTMASSFLILKGYVHARNTDLILLAAVFFGSALTGVINGKVPMGLIPQILIASASYLTPFLLIAAAWQQGLGSGFWLPVSLLAILGSICGIVTNLVKSNKSYINKSKRKRAIT